MELEKGRKTEISVIRLMVLHGSEIFVFTKGKKKSLGVQMRKVLRRIVKPVKERDSESQGGNEGF